MPITILNYVKTVVGDKDTYSAEDFSRNGVGMTGGFQLRRQHRLLQLLPLHLGLLALR